MHKIEDLLSSYIPKKFIRGTWKEEVSHDSGDELSDVSFFVIDKMPRLKIDGKTSKSEINHETPTRLKTNDKNKTLTKLKTGDKTLKQNARNETSRLNTEFIFDKSDAIHESNSTFIPKSTESKSFKCSESVMLSSEIKPGIKVDDHYINMTSKEAIEIPRLELSAVDKALSKCALKPGYEQQYSVPEYSEGLRQKKRERQAERAKTRGPEWFNMPAKELNEELKNDLEILRMRKALDPKHFYKKNDPLPKYFQVGTVLDSPVDYYHARVPKKDRKRTLVEELLNDAEFKKYGKKKYTEVLNKYPKWKNRQGKKNS